MLLISATIRAQSTSQCPQATSKGDDFWVMFLYNHNYNSGSHTEEQRVYLFGDQTTSVNITNNTSGTITTTLHSPNFTSMQLCGSNQQQIATVYNGGYHITSSEKIWVYADDYIDNNQDAAFILPTAALGAHYIVQDYPSSNVRGAEVGFVATQDNTVLSMTVPCDVLGSTITAGTPLTINLNTGQTYMLLASAYGSFSGMEVTSNGKPFAMFVAGQNTAVPISGSGRDYTYEQALPVDLWGTEFIISGIAGQSINRILVTSSTNNCLLYESGTLVAGPLLAGQTWESDFPPSGQWRLSATSPVQVILYSGSYQTAGNNGDPSSVTIPPLDRGICDARFSTISTSAIPNNKHYINIICHQNHDAFLRLDGSPLPSSGSVNTLGNYRCHRVPLQVTSTNQGLHHLQNSSGPFIAYVYGLGSWESYAYTLGISLDTTPPQEPVYDTTDYSDTICQNTTYNGYGFSISATYDGTHDFWRSDTVGDTLHQYHLTLTILPASTGDTTALLLLGDTLFYHGDTLTTAGTFTHYLTAANGCDSIVTIHLNFTEYRFIDTVAFVDTVCQNEAYNNHGFILESSETLTTGTLERWRSDTIGDTLRYCYLTLSVLPLSSSDTTAHIILGDTLFYQGDTLTIAGVYTYHFTAANGCDSLLTFHLHYEALSLTASAEGICPGESVTLTASGTHYAWWSASPPDTGVDAQQGSTTITVSPMQTTTYSLCAYDGGPVLALVTVGVEAPPELCVRLSRPFIDFDFPVVTFTDCSEGRAHSTWSFSDGIVIENTAARRQFHHPLPDSVEVTLQSCNRYNCCSDTAFYVKSLIRSVWFPNVFTPDEETNNRFGITTSFEIVKFELHIYNRQGLLVYHTEDPAAMWDGTRDGRPCPQGAYVYHWHVRDATDYVKNGTGTITLIR